MSKTWFLVTLKGSEQDEHGKVSKVSKKYLLSETGYTEAETKVNELDDVQVKGFSIENIAPQKLSEVFEIEGKERCYKVKVTFDIESESGKIKKNHEYMLVDANSIVDACKEIDKQLETVLITNRITECKEFELTDIL